jgi:tetraacyldisaccharide 4'-kinase
MKAPPFWDEPAGLTAWLFSPFGWLYGMATALRMRGAGQRIGIPVVCVGNFTAGGAGKTPAAVLIAALLQRLGETPFILSRGYGGTAAGPLLVDTLKHTAAECGDEPLLLARHAPTVVAADRIAGAAFAKAQGATVIVMDDGLQNPSLAKDCTLAVIDAAAGFGNGFCIPAGPLRAPVRLQMPKIDAVLLIGTPADRDTCATPFTPFGRPVLHARLQADADAIAALRGVPLLAFAGIGRPEKFFGTLRDAELNVVLTRAFADHHPYSAADGAALLQDAAQRGLTLVTTEKDAVRLPSSMGSVVTLPVHLETDEAALCNLLSQALSHRPQAHGSPGVV